MKSNLILQEKVAQLGYFLKFFVNISIFGFVYFDEGLDFKGWEDLVEFFVVVIASLAFDSHPSVIFEVISVSSGQKAKNS